MRKTLAVLMLVLLGAQISHAADSVPEEENSAKQSAVNSSQQAEEGSGLAKKKAKLFKTAKETAKDSATDIIKDTAKKVFIGSGDTAQMTDSGKNLSPINKAVNQSTAPNQADVSHKNAGKAESQSIDKQTLRSSSNDTHDFINPKKGGVNEATASDATKPSNSAADISKDSVKGTDIDGKPQGITENGVSQSLAQQDPKKSIKEWESAQERPQTVNSSSEPGKTDIKPPNSEVVESQANQNALADSKPQNIVENGGARPLAQEGTKGNVKEMESALERPQLTNPLSEPVNTAIKPSMPVVEGSQANQNVLTDSALPSKGEQAIQDSRGVSDIAGEAGNLKTGTVSPNVGSASASGAGIISGIGSALNGAGSVVGSAATSGIASQAGNVAAAAVGAAAVVGATEAIIPGKGSSGSETVKESEGKKVESASSASAEETSPAQKQASFKEATGNGEGVQAGNGAPIATGTVAAISVGAAASATGKKSLTKDNGGTRPEKNTTSSQTQLMVIGGMVQERPLSLKGIVSTAAGIIGKKGFEDGPAGISSFNLPMVLSTDGETIFLADYGSSTIRKISIHTGESGTIAGTPGKRGFADGVGATALFDHPSGIVVVGTDLYVSDSGNHVIRKIAISSGEVSTIAGSAGAFGSQDGIGIKARFKSPHGITTDGTNLYVADTDNSTIRKVALATGEVTTLAGSADIADHADGVGGASRFNHPAAITTDGKNLYVADTRNLVIRKITISTNKVSTLAGKPGVDGAKDGVGEDARFNLPMGIASDGSAVYLADTANNTIRKVDCTTRKVTTLAGAPGMNGVEDGHGKTAHFNNPYGIAAANGELFVADTLNLESTEFSMVIYRFLPFIVIPIFNFESSMDRSVMA